MMSPSVPHLRKPVWKNHESLAETWCLVHAIEEVISLSWGWEKVCNVACMEGNQHKMHKPDAQLDLALLAQGQKGKICITWHFETWVYFLWRITQLKAYEPFFPGKRIRTPHCLYWQPIPDYTHLQVIKSGSIFSCIPCPRLDSAPKRHISRETSRSHKVQALKSCRDVVQICLHLKTGEFARVCHFSGGSPSKILWERRAVVRSWLLGR